jgi:hypothetical protein
VLGEDDADDVVVDKDEKDDVISIYNETPLVNE